MQDRPAGVAEDDVDPEVRERILGAALALFAQRGYAGTTMQDIARAAGMAAGGSAFAVPVDIRFEDQVADAVGCALAYHRALAALPVPLSARAGLHVGIVYFLWIGIFNVVVIAQFWAFANDLYTQDQGKRLFPVIGVGASPSRGLRKGVVVDIESTVESIKKAVEEAELMAV